MGRWNEWYLFYSCLYSIAKSRLDEDEFLGLHQDSFIDPYYQPKDWEIEIQKHPQSTVVFIDGKLVTIDDYFIAKSQKYYDEKEPDEPDWPEESQEKDILKTPTASLFHYNPISVYKSVRSMSSQQYNDKWNEEEKYKEFDSNIIDFQQYMTPTAKNPSLSLTTMNSFYPDSSVLSAMNHYCNHDQQYSLYNSTHQKPTSYVEYTFNVY